ncbi:MAG: hypothetical protein V3U54_07805 [Thermodesulfobacteriota bacterium]
MKYTIAGFLLQIAGCGVIVYVSAISGVAPALIWILVGGGTLMAIGGAFMSVARDRSNYLTQLQDVAEKLEKDKKP